MNIENNKLNWNEILEQEDRLIHNSDRKYNNHCCSLEAISEECIYNLHKEKYIDLTLQEAIKNSIGLNTVNEKLCTVLSNLTEKQKIVVILYYWHGYNQREISKYLNCDRTAVTYLIKRALDKIQKEYIKK